MQAQHGRSCLKLLRWHTCATQYIVSERNVLWWGAQREIRITANSDTLSGILDGLRACAHRARPATMSELPTNVQVYYMAPNNTAAAHKKIN